MKILIISDSHGHVANLKVTMDIAKKSAIDAIIHCGDWNTLETVEAVLSSNIPLYTILGNADVRPEVGEKLKTKSKGFNEKFLIINIGGKKIGITHKQSDIKKYFGDKKLDVIFYGHMHSKDESKMGEIKTVRPGATINGINFAVYNTASDKIEFVNE